MFDEVDAVLRINPTHTIEIHACIPYGPGHLQVDVVHDELMEEFVAGLDVSQLVLAYDPHMFGGTN